jgi:hypothetical protein
LYSAPSFQATDEQHKAHVGPCVVIISKSPGGAVHFSQHSIGSTSHLRHRAMRLPPFRTLTRPFFPSCDSPALNQRFRPGPFGCYKTSHLPDCPLSFYRALTADSVYQRRRKDPASRTIGHLKTDGNRTRPAAPFGRDFRQSYLATHRYRLLWTAQRCCVYLWRYIQKLKTYGKRGAGPICRITAWAAGITARACLKSAFLSLLLMPASPEQAPANGHCPSADLIDILSAT